MRSVTTALIIRFVASCYAVAVCILPLVAQAAPDLTPGGDDLRLRPRVWIGSDSKRWATQIQKQLTRQLEELSTIRSVAGRLPKVWSIVFTEKIPSAGYHSPSLTDPNGNPTVFISPAEMILNGDSGILAHEVFHLVHSQVRPDEEDWIKEGLALVIEAKASGRLIKQIPLAFRYPTVSLMRPIRWFESVVDTKTSSKRKQKDKDAGRGQLDGSQNLDPSAEELLRGSQYAQLQLFFLYAFRFCGGWNWFEELAFSKVESAKSGDRLKGVERFDRALVFAQTRAALTAVDRTDGVGPDLRPYCGSTELLHRQFQTLKYWPRFDLEDGYLVPDPTKSGGLSQLPEGFNESQMGPLSAIAYEKAGDVCQLGGDQMGPSICLKIKGP